MTFLELAKKRFSCRKFSDRPIEAEKLQTVLEACNVAPTAKEAPGANGPVSAGLLRKQ